MRALACSVFPAYDFPRVDEMCPDELAEVVGAALWLKDEEAKAVKKPPRRRGR
jgi:hypothetical protein